MNALIAMAIISIGMMGIKMYNVNMMTDLAISVIYF